MNGSERSIFISLVPPIPRGQPYASEDDAGDDPFAEPLCVFSE